MSIKLMAAVWEDDRLSGDSLLLALALADHANDDGLCWPSVTRLAQRIRRSRRHTMRLLQRLSQSGYINTEKRAGAVNHYVLSIVLTSDRAVSPVENVTSDRAVSPVLVTELSHGTSDRAESHEPSCNHQENHHMHDANFLPSAEQQAAILFAGRQPSSNGCGEAERKIAASGWSIGNHDLYLAAIYFVAATEMPVPRVKSTRREWLAALAEHIEEYGANALKDLYPLAVQKLRDGKIRAGRPGALTKTLPVVMMQAAGDGIWKL